jgi:hypothetical protein
VALTRLFFESLQWGSAYIGLPPSLKLRRDKLARQEDEGAGQGVILTNYGLCPTYFDLCRVATHKIGGLQVIVVKYVATQAWPIMTNYG